MSLKFGSVVIKNIDEHLCTPNCLFRSGCYYVVCMLSSGTHCKSQGLHFYQSSLLFRKKAKGKEEERGGKYKKKKSKNIFFYRVFFRRSKENDTEICSKEPKGEAGHTVIRLNLLVYLLPDRLGNVLYQHILFLI